MTGPIFLLFAVLFLAYANGANDNFKGVATLFGSGTADYRGALAWATASTLGGSITALFVADALVHVFSGAGIVPDRLVGSSEFVVAVAVGAATVVLLATFLSVPVSTTHALTGALVGAGWVLAGGEVHLDVLGSKVFLPLLLSPIVAFVLTASIAPLLPAKRDSGSKERRTGGVLRRAHFLSAGAVSFARGLNDTPKIVALLVAAQAVGTRHGLALIGLAIALGGILNARRIAETMGRKITAMDESQGFAANCVTAGLVIIASPFGMPVSTTHVSCGSLFGLGAVTGQARWKTVGTILLAWIITLPLAAFLAAAVGTVF